MIKFRTETGSVYLIDGLKVVRLEMTHGMRRDGEWLELRYPVILEIGKPARLILEPLGEGLTTVRNTSNVVSIETVQG